MYQLRVGWIVQVAGCSPDSWVQLCIQAAYTLLFGEHASTYEAVMTKVRVTIVHIHKY